LGSRRARSIRQLRHGKPVGEFERLFERVGQARGDIGAHHQAIDHHVDVMGEFLVERRHFADLIEFAVDLDALVALLAELAELLAVLALPAAHHRRQEIKPRAFGQRHDAVDHLRDGLAFDRQPGRRRIGHADARPEQPHVVVDFGDGADGRARIARRRLLLNGDGGRQAVDLIDVRLLHHLQKLARVGGKALDIAALALGVDGVEGERAFAGTGQAGEYHQPVARQVEIDIFQVMLARAADGDHARVCGTDAVAAAFVVGTLEQIVHALIRSPPSPTGSGINSSGDPNCGRTFPAAMWIPADAGMSG
jgi:hypothetical protein